MDALFEEYSPRTAHRKVMEQLAHEQAAAGTHPTYLKATGETQHYEAGSRTPESEEKV